MSTTLLTLPPELLLYIISALPLQTLLTLSSTSSQLHKLSMISLQTLCLSILPRKLHHTLSHLSTFEDMIDHQTSPSNRITITLEPKNSSQPGSPSREHPSNIYTNGNSPKLHRDTLIRLANDRFTALLPTSISSNLRTLTLTMWSPDASTLSHLATHFPNLNHLDLLFHHPTHRHSALYANYFPSQPKTLAELPKASPMWNTLAGMGGENAKQLQLQHLESLRIEGSGITSAQLMALISHNRRLRMLAVKCVRGLDQELVHWLGERASQRTMRLDVLRIEACPGLVLKGGGRDDYDSEFEPGAHSDMTWITQLVDNGLQELILVKCPGVNGTHLQKLNSRVWRLKKSDFGLDGDQAAVVHGTNWNGVLPVHSPGQAHGMASRNQWLPLGPLEVDPDCL